MAKLVAMAADGEEDNDSATAEWPQADEVASRLALRQHGVFTREQLIGAGVPESTIGNRVRAGRWVRHAGGVYRVSAVPASPHSVAMAATLGLRGSVASHQTAAVLHRLPLLAGSDDQRTHVTSSGVSRRRTPGVVTHRVTTLDPLDTCEVDGVPATTRPRTLVDLAGTLRAERYRRLFDSETASGEILDALVASYDRAPKRGRRGMALAGQLLEQRLDRTAVATSELERRLLELVAAFSLPEPTCQFLPPWGAPKGIGRVDFAYPSARLLIEVDGRAFHATASAFEADRRRDQRAAAAGWRTLRFTWAQIVGEPAQVAATIRQALAVAARAS